ncbi:MAG: hypothetical protein ACREN2_08190 [Candidatus Dormibacteria bacterium]
MNGLAYRFQAADCYHRQYIASVDHAGNSPRSVERYNQESYLFAFFTTALSTLECTCYALSAMGALILPGEFRMSTDDERSKICIRSTQRGYKANFREEAVTACLDSLVSDVRLKTLSSVRNVLVHRVAPPRHFYRGGDRDGEADWGDFAIPLNRETTGEYREWLGTAVTSLVDGAAAFAQTQL